MNKTRQVEMAVSYSNGSWEDGHFVDIPLDTPDDKIEEVGRQVLLAATNKGPAVGIAGVSLYNSMDDCDE